MWKYIIDTVQIIFVICSEYLKYTTNIQSYNNYIINVFDYLSNKNIIYIKILQWDIYKMFSNNKVIGDYTKTFCSNAPYNKEDINYEVIHKIKKYANENNKLLYIYDEKPINSGTVALVFKGTLDNKPIAIKLLRKNIHTKIKIGIDNIIITVKIINFISSFFIKQSNNILNSIESNKFILLKQTNLLEEIKNIEIFQEITNSYEKIIVPYVYKYFTTDVSNDIIVMEFIEGSTLEHLDNRILKQHKKEIDKFILNMYTIHNAIHSDLHAGNIILTNDNKICLIDFGLIIVLNDREKNLIIDLFFCIKNANYERLLLIIAKLISNDKVFINNFMEKCKNLDTYTNIFTLLVDNKNVIDSVILFNFFQIVQEVDIPKDTNIYFILLSLISSFSLIELIKDTNIGVDVGLREFFSEFI